ncbi:ornithine cyclodeaminase [Pelagerythrobacter aerophilus]
MRLVEVEHVVALVAERGLEAVLAELVDHIEADFRRWDEFDKSPRFASHSPSGVIELMPTADSRAFGFKYVNGHPSNQAAGLQTVTGFGVLADVATGYPYLIAEMTLTTALRTAAMSVLAARHLARPDARSMALIGLGAQSEFQAFAFSKLLGIRELTVYDVDPAASDKFRRNMDAQSIAVRVAASAPEATEGADIITTATADKQHAHVVSANMVGAGIHLNAIGGDCPGKTELQPAILNRASVFVEYLPQTRIEGEIQQMPADFPATELWRVIAGEVPGRQHRDEVTLFDSVGFAIEDFSTLRFLFEATSPSHLHREIDLLAKPTDPRDLFGVLDAQAVVHCG